MSSRSAFAAGVRAMLPLLLGVVPFGLAYAISARAAGLSPLETQLMSLAVFAGGAQVSAVGLLAQGVGPGTLLATTFVINARHMLYGLTLAPRLRTPSGQRPGWRSWLLAAAFLTDEAFGVSLALGAGSLAFLLGTELVLFVAWNLTTAVGAAALGAVPDPARLGLDLVFPLAFLALLVPNVRARRDLAVALVAGAAALVLLRWLPAGAAILLGTLAGAAVGALRGAHTA